MSKCLDCNKDTTPHPTAGIGHYCVNRDCKRFGLITALVLNFGENDE